MSEERPKGFLSRVFGPPEDDHTAVYSTADDRDDGYDDYDGYDEYDDEEEEIEARRREEGIQETGRSFTVERAAEIIKHLPPEVPRSSAVRIVRQTLTAAGIKIEDLTESTRNREARLTSEIEQREDRMQNLRQRTDEQVRELEKRIREAKETRDNGISQEERKITTARDGLEDVERVREFFSLPKMAPQQTSGEEHSDRETSHESVGDETMIIDRSSFDEERSSGNTYRSNAQDSSAESETSHESVDDTRVIRGPLSERWEREKREGRGEDRRR